ncbi:GNAT family N-acetyltransferase [Weissella viridescens]|uniref:GNAT family N-acetyltransferase n=1 Tax=Weissella viridescens TaxID=1629 RepID=UPI0025765FC2|nr:GNAT family N-acetyltransferase [Weissella viridescens]WJI91878.1 GNAT family N-acetyltransferase [Weissella viridescens]
MIVKIRTAQKADLPELLSIYAPYVTRSTATFDESVPTLTDFTQQFQQIQRSYPYLVAENDQDQLLGYCYAHAYNSRFAYQWSVETTIYIVDSAQGQHVGQALYTALEQQLKTHQALLFIRNKDLKQLVISKTVVINLDTGWIPFGWKNKSHPCLNTLMLLIYK